MQAVMAFKNAFHLSIGKELSAFIYDLIKCFLNYIPKRIVQCHYQNLSWVTGLIKAKLKPISILTNKYFKKSMICLNLRNWLKHLINVMSWFKLYKKTMFLSISETYVLKHLRLTSNFFDRSWLCSNLLSKFLLYF